MSRVLKFVDGFVRNRPELIAEVKHGDHPGRFIARALAVYLVFSALYGLAMGSFRWAHPGFYFSDFEIEIADGGGPSSITGVVDTMDVASSSITTANLETDVPLTGRTIRFNRTDPTPPFQIARVDRTGPYSRITLAISPDGPRMSADRPWLFTLLAAAKVPALFLVTLAVCVPALYVLNVAMGWGLRFVPTLALLMFALAGTSVMLVVVAPIVLFFNVLTDHYHFMMVLHVGLFALAGIYGVQTLALGLNVLREGADQRRSPGRLLTAWLLLYMFVGCQMAWSLKPWVGTPYLTEFAAFRPSSTNFYAAVFSSAGKLGDARR
jgi:hypothetical protein